MKKLLFLFISFIVCLQSYGQLTETQRLTNYAGHDTTVTISLTDSYDWIAYFTFTNADANHDTVYLDVSGKVNGSSTYTLLSSTTLIFTDAVAATRSYNLTCDTDYPVYEGIWNYLRFRFRTNAASDEVINFYFRKYAE